MVNLETFCLNCSWGGFAGNRDVFGRCTSYSAVTNLDNSKWKSWKLIFVQISFFINTMKNDLYLSWSEDHIRIDPLTRHCWGWRTSIKVFGRIFFTYLNLFARQYFHFSFLKRVLKFIWGNEIFSENTLIKKVLKFWKVGKCAFSHLVLISYNANDL